MQAQDIDKLIASLGKEIRQITNEVHRDDALIRLQEIAKTYAGEDKLISSYDIAKDLRENPPPIGVMSGIPRLDAITDGFTPHQLIVLAGITKHGKTEFAMFLSRALSEQYPAWIVFEGGARELVQRSLDRGLEPPLFYTPVNIPERSLDWIEKKIIEAKAKFGSKIMFIDHLGFIAPERQTNNPYLDIGHIMRALKTLAAKWDMVLVVLAHLKKIEIDRHPNLEDLSGSASIAQEADTVLFVWRKTTKDKKTGEVSIGNETNVSVQANRRTGKTGNVMLLFNQGNYVEIDRRYDEPALSKKDQMAQDMFGL